MPEVNPSILSWARETAGFTLEDAAKKVGINTSRGILGADRLAMLEAGETEPTRLMLLKMAKQYRRPLLTFYLDKPPTIATRGEDFRTLPEEFAQRETALIDTLLREIRARQDMVRNLMEIEDEAEPLQFVGTFDMKKGPGAVADAIKETLGFNLEQFRRGDGNTGFKGFKYLRERTEAAGIFVLLIGNLGNAHSTLSVELFRGFALADPIAPFIVINDQDSERAWSFTLLHELAHIWLGRTGVSGGLPTNKIETFCNDVASRILLPSHELVSEQNLDNISQERVMERISKIAEACQVSHSMVAYKFYRKGMISRETWLSVTKIFRQQWLRNKEAKKKQVQESKGGPSYYTVRRHKLGNRLLTLSQRMLAEGALSPSKAAAILDVKANNVYTLTNTTA